MTAPSKLLPILLLALLLLGPACAHAGDFDLDNFRHRIATDRASGFAEGREALRTGVYADDPARRRLLLWYMGGAAIGAADDDWLAEVVQELQSQARATPDPAAGGLAGLLHGARLLDRGLAGEGLVEVLQAAKALQDAEPQLQRIASGELCRGYSVAERYTSALSHCQRHERLMAASGDAAGMARARYLHASTLSSAGKRDASVPKWREARDAFLQLGLDGLADRTAGSLASDLNALGQHAEARVMAGHALRAAQRTGSPISLAVASGVLGEALLGLGELDQAVTTIEAALAASEGLEHARIRGHLLQLLVLALERQDASAHRARIETLREQRAALEPSEPSPEQVDTIAELERELRQRELDLRIRELEQEAYRTQVELEQFRIEAERRAEVLRAQRVATILAVVAAVALGGALFASALLLRAQRRLAASLRDQAYRDVLTGLPNRRALIEALSQPADGRALLLVDIDHFKAINDRGGHPHGDAVLASVARCLQQELPGDALLARLGGEEFVALVGNLNADQARALAEQLRHAVAATAHGSPGSEEPPGRVTVSIGLALLDAGTTASDDQWMRRADAALYRAKAGGRNRVEMG